MVFTRTARPLEPGAFDAFRVTFEAGGTVIPDVAQHSTRIRAVRDVTDENAALTFGFIDGTLAALREVRPRYAHETPASRVGDYVDGVLLDDSYEVTEEVEP